MSATPCAGPPSSPLNRWKAALYRPGIAEAVGAGRGDAPTCAPLHFLRDQPALSRMLFVDTKTWPADDLPGADATRPEGVAAGGARDLQAPLLGRPYSEPLRHP